MAKVKITLIRSVIGSPQSHRRTVESLGLRRLQHSVVRPADLPTLGMIRQVSHLLHVEEVPEEAESK